MTNWTAPKIWEGGSCWIIGGGTSIASQFGLPEDVLSRVDFNKLSDAMSDIHDKHVIGVNVAYQLGPWISVCYFGDRAFLQYNHEKLKYFNGLKVTHGTFPKRYLKFCEGIKHLKMSGNEGISLDPKVINWNRSSGAAAINLAVLFGVKRIFLFGFDMKAEEGKTHWHDKYGNYRIAGKMFENYLQVFQNIWEDAKNIGVEILNVNPDSAIGCFPKITLNEALSLK